MHLVDPSNPLAIVLSEEEFLNFPTGDNIPEGYMERDNYPTQYIQKANGEIILRTRIRGNRWPTRPVNRIPYPEVKGSKAAAAAPHPDAKLLTPNVCILPEGKKVPMRLLFEVIAFFKSVMDNKMKDVLGSGKSHGQHEYEAMANIVYNINTKEYRVTIPTQRVSKASVSYERDDYQEADGDIKVVDIHSHNTMSAFFSGTDNNDDKSNYCYSGVVGKLDNPNPSTVRRLNLGEERYTDLKIADIFEDRVTLPEVPQAWLDKVTVQTFPLYGGYYAGEGWYGSQKSNHGQGSQSTVAKKGPDGNHWENLATAVSTKSYDSLLAALGEEFTEYLGLNKVAAVPSTYNPDDAVEEFLSNIESPATSLLLSMGLGLANLDPVDYPGLRTLGVYEYLVLKDKLMSVVDEDGTRGLYIEGIPGIMPAGAFIKNDPYLSGYAVHMNTKHNIPLTQIYDSVQLFVEHICFGTVY